MKKPLFTRVLQYTASAGLMIAAGLPVLAQSTADASPAVELVPFDRFIANVANSDSNAVVAHTANAALSGAVPDRVANDHALVEMRRHILNLYKGVHVTHSFLQGALTFDCIPIEQQPSVRLLGLKDIAPPPAFPAGVEAAAPAGSSPAAFSQSGEPKEASLVLDASPDPFGNATSCEAGTVPIRRITLEQMSEFPNLRAFLGKSPGGSGAPPLPSESSAAAIGAASDVSPLVYKHTGGSEFAYNIGANAVLNLWNPLVNVISGQVHSISQMWLQGFTPDNNFQSIESGWRVAPAQYHDNLAHLFVYYTPDGYASGYYDTLGPGFVQWSGSLYPGARFPAYSAPGGSQFEVRLTWTWMSGNWYLWVNRQIIGYYPGSLFGNGELATHSTVIQYGGEILGDSRGFFYFPQMGSGDWGTQGYGSAAYQRELWHLDVHANAIPANLTVNNNCASRSSMLGPYTDPNPSWQTYFFFGGPGGYCF
jgi:hypothetical protein